MRNKDGGGYVRMEMHKRYLKQYKKGGMGTEHFILKTDLWHRCWTAPTSSKTEPETEKSESSDPWI